MPVNKNAYLRYQILDQCFSNKLRKFSFDDLVDFVSDKLGYNISPRQMLGWKRLFPVLNIVSE